MRSYIIEEYVYEKNHGILLMLLIVFCLIDYLSKAQNFSKGQPQEIHQTSIQSEKLAKVEKSSEDFAWQGLYDYMKKALSTEQDKITYGGRWADYYIFSLKDKDESFISEFLSTFENTQTYYIESSAYFDLYLDGKLNGQESFDFTVEVIVFDDRSEPCIYRIKEVNNASNVFLDNIFNANQ